MCVCVCVLLFLAVHQRLQVSGFLVYVWNWNPETSNFILQNQRFFIRGKNHPMLEISSKLDYPTSQRNTFP
jgi:hypothetical protein